MEKYFVAQKLFVKQELYFRAFGFEYDIACLPSLILMTASSKFIYFHLT